MNAWPVKDLVYIGLIVFNLGAVIGTIRYVLKRIERDLSNIFGRLSENEKEIAEVRGKLNGKKDK